jgi:hypothetical protein
MENDIRHDHEGDTWLVVDQDGERTLFRLVEVGEGGDVLRLARELRAPAVVVDVALPALPTLDRTSGMRRRSPKLRVILLNVRTVTGDETTTVVASRKPQNLS